MAKHKLIAKSGVINAIMVLVDGVAKIDTGLLLEHCRIISESED